MKIRALLGISLLVLLASLLALGHRRSASAQAQDNSSITGQVVWCAPLPLAADGAGTAPSIAPGEAGMPGVTDGGSPTPIPMPPVAPPTLPPGGATPGSAPAFPAPYPIYPIRPQLIPAGAVLVAVQGTGLSARTDENGKFEIDGLPTGMYFTVAAGPAAGRNSAVAIRPNVLVSAGQSLDLGTLSLSGSCSYGPVVSNVPSQTPGTSGVDTPTPDSSSN